MAVTVLDSKDLITHLTTGETPMPAGVAEDNAKQRAAADKENGKAPAKDADKAKTAETPDPNDDVEGEDGLTPREKRDYTAAMLRSLGRKHQKQLDAEQFAAAQYNDKVLAEKRAEKAEQEREAFKEELAKLKQPAAKADEGKEPEREKYATDKEYADAMIDWRVEQKFKAREIEAAQQRQRTIEQNTQTSLNRAVELVPDFEAVTGAAELNIPGHIVHLMQESGLFAEFGYHFAKTPDDLAKLAIATPNKLKLEFQKIESKLTPFASRTAAGADGKANGQKPSTSETESASSTTAASGNGADPSRHPTESTGNGAGPSKPRGTAPVITPLSAGSTSQVEKLPAEMNTREMIQDWQKRNRANLGLRKRH
jgi:chemotaxis protein histidine kinase CheA